ncbi:MAG TPA: hypothetical protein VJV03_17695, partial [Pyrinomonadaceae bacterium]|nr:hypothetical protein [Pyrinomonadaceae bacterium]
MRMKLLLGLLCLGLVAAAIFPLTRSDAARKKATTGPALQEGAGPKGKALPNYDIRLEGKGEFSDFDISTPHGKEAALQHAAIRARASAVEGFRANARAGRAQNLRAIANETGSMKHFFIDGDTLSDPQSDTPDNIARGFLKRHGQVFAVPSSDPASLKLR